ncbi:MAG TPA: AsmA family protein [Gammaproteobacteria bacterium]|jgi:AsmA protein
MKKALKITGIVLGILVLLVILLAVALPFLINPNSFKEEIAKLVKDKTGRELVIQGDIKLSIFPWLGMQIGPAELSNAKGFSSVPFASITETDVHVKFWPLLHRQVEVGEVKLDGLNLDLEKDADGHDNWQDISDHLAHPTAKTEGESGSNIDLSVAGVAVTDSQVRWTDAQKHQQYTISDFSLKLGAFVSAKPLSVESGFDFTGTNPAVQGHVDFSGTASADLEHRLYTADDAKLDMQAQGDAVPGGQVKASLHWQHVAYNAEQSSIAVNGLTAGAYGVNLQLEAQGNNIGKDANFTGSAKLARFSPRDLLKALGHPDLANARDTGAFSAAFGSFGFVAGSSSAALSNMDFTLDDTHMTGSAAVKDFKTRAATFDLDVDKLDADRYLPPQQLGTPDKPREEIDLDKVGLPLRTLRLLNVQGRLHVGNFTLLDAKVSDLSMGVTAQDGLVDIKPFSATVYGGSADGEISIDAREANADQPIVNETVTLHGVQMAGLTQDLFKTSKFSGTVDLTAAVRAQGRVVGEMRRTLNGRISFEVKDGALDGVNIWDAIARTYARNQGLSAPPPAPAHTEFSDARGSSIINRGIMVDRGFSATLQSLALTGAGKLDLTDLTLDYGLRGRITGTPPAGADVRGLRGSTLTLHLTGALGNMHAQPEFGAASAPKSADASHGGE